MAVTAACGERDSTQIAGPIAEAPTSGEFAAPTSDLDSHWRQIAEQQLPGFSGVFVDLDGKFVVNVTNPAIAAQAREFARTFPGSNGRDIRIRQVDFDFSQLSDWRDIAFSEASSTASFFDADEVNNAIVVGVASRDDIPDEASRLNAAGVPLSALRFRVVGPGPHDRATLNDTHGFGGTALRRTSDGLPVCTIGVTGYFNGSEAFVTASHCSDVKFGPDSKSFQQKLSGSGSLAVVGSEIFDPTQAQVGHTCAISGSFYPCRYSDTSVFDWSAAASMTPYEIARPQYSASTGIGPRVISTSSPSFVVTDAVAAWDVYPGQPIEKIGDRSGWTTGSVFVCADHTDPTGATIDCYPSAGPVGATCFNYRYVVSPTEIYALYCQFEAELYSDVGDSGAPVFTEESRYPIIDQQTVKLVGTIWGGPTLPGSESVGLYYGSPNDGFADENENYTWFSTWGAIQMDLTSTGGSIDVCHPMGNPAC